MVAEVHLRLKSAIHHIRNAEDSTKTTNGIVRNNLSIKTRLNTEIMALSALLADPAKPGAALQSPLSLTHSLIE